jgi:hypothetical protein
VSDCSGDQGTAGSGGGGSAGPTGPAGEPGQPGPAGPGVFSLFIDDFFTTDGDPDGELPLTPVAIVEPALPEDSPIAFRMAVPQTYHAGNPVTMRLFFYRTGFDEGCFVFRVDARRLQHGSGIDFYGETRWVRVDLNQANTLAAQGAGAQAMLVIVDLPVNTDVTGSLQFPDDLAVGQFLAFELNAVESDGGSYTLLGVEFFESLEAMTPEFPHDIGLEGPPESDECDLVPA